MDIKKKNIKIKIFLFLFLLFGLTIYKAISWNILVQNSKQSIWVGPYYDPSVKIAYIDRNNIYISSLDGTNKEDISSSIYQGDTSVSFTDPIWSPSKNKLAFVGIRTIKNYKSQYNVKYSIQIMIFFKEDNRQPVKIYEFTQDGQYYSSVTKPIWSTDESHLKIYDSSNYVEDFIIVSLIPLYVSERYQPSQDVVKFVDRPENQELGGGIFTSENTFLSSNNKYRIILKERKCFFIFICWGDEFVELQKLFFFDIGPKMRISDVNGSRPVWFADSQHFLFQEFETISVYNTSGKRIHQIRGENFDI